jgi:probable rRNA maturation factor
MSVEIANDSGRDVDEAALAGLAGHVMEQMRVHPESDLSIAFVGTDAMASLHEEWMAEPGATDVMAFPMDELRPAPPGTAPQPGMLGDVVICLDVAEQQAVAAGHQTSAEVELLLTHGLLHLLGYDHAEPDEEAEMFGLQSRLLAEWRAAGR